MVTIELTQLQATLLGVAVAAFAFMLGLATFFMSRTFLPLSPMGKLWDRMYELDKLALLYPDAFATFTSLANLRAPYFYSDPTLVPRNGEYYRLKAIAYFYLNFFEEIYQVTSSSRRLSRSFEREGWDRYIFHRLRHALIREVFVHEGDALYHGKFAAFLLSHSADWSQPADPYFV